MNYKKIFLLIFPLLFLTGCGSPYVDEFTTLAFFLSPIVILFVYLLYPSFSNMDITNKSKH